MPAAVLAPGRSASRHWSGQCHPEQHTAPHCAHSPTHGSHHQRTGGWKEKGDGLGQPSHSGLRGPSLVPWEAGEGEEEGLHLMVCSSCSDSWLRVTPLVSAMNTAFPEASWAWRNGIYGCQVEGSADTGCLCCLVCSGCPRPP